MGPIQTAYVKVAGKGVAGADIKFFEAGTDIPFYSREAKSITGIGSFNSAVEHAIEKQGIRESSGDIYVQVPDGTPAAEWVQRLEGSLRSKGKEAIARNVRIQVADPKGRILIDHLLYGITWPTGG